MKKPSKQETLCQIPYILHKSFEEKNEVFPFECLSISHDNQSNMGPFQNHTY